MSIDSTGSVTSTTAIGLYAATTSTGTVLVKNNGTIQGTTVGIFAKTTGSGTVTVDSTGDISNSATTGTLGIYARNAGAGAVYVKSNGTVSSRGTSIYARSTDGGSVTVKSVGSLTSTTAAGIYAGSASGSVTVNNNGAINSATSSIVALTSGAITITSTGDLKPTSGIGIYGKGSDGARVSVTKTGGTITSAGTSIYAQSASGAVTVDNTGALTTSGAIGIFARSNGSGTVKAYNQSTITSQGSAIYGKSATGAVIVKNTGYLKSATASGIYAATTSTGTLSVTNNAKISGTTYGIFATTTGSGAVTVDSTGDVTNSATTGKIGIFARNAGAGAVYVKSNGTIGSRGTGIYARSTDGGSATAKSVGNITSATSTGIYAGSNSGSVSINNNGAINSATSSIVALTSGAITITSTGDLKPTTGVGIYAKGSDGALVSVTKTGGTITSVGTSIYAQSATGGVTVNNTGALTTNAMGIFARSNGSGTVKAYNYSTIGSQAAAVYAKSASGAVIVNNTGNLTSATTAGIYAMTASTGTLSVKNNATIQGTTYGIFASTTGSGAVTVDSTGDITNSATTGKIGIFARNAGAGAVYVKNNGYVNSRGTGIYARSTDGGSATVKSIGNVRSATYTGIYAGSNTGSVSIDSTGDITTPTRGGLVAMNADGGTVAVKSNGKINSFFEAIYAKSTTGAISVESTGDVTSSSSAIKSVGGNSSTVTVHSGTVYGIYSAVEFSGGGTNTLKNYGSLSGNTYRVAVLGSTGNETIDNYNLITGNINLDSGTNAFFNRSTGTFISSATVNLGGGTLTNEGTLSPGGLGVEQTTAITGSFVQTSTGTFIVDIDHSSVDLLTITGTANVAGTVAPNVFALPSASGGLMIADTTGGVTNTATATSNATTDFSLQVIAGNELWLTWVPVSIFDLFTDPITPNQQSISVYFDALRQSADTSAALLALVNAVKGLPSEAEVLAALDRLTPEHYLAQVNDTLIASQFFVTNMMSCPTAEGELSVVTEGECLWAKVGGRVFDEDHTRTNIGGDVKAYSVSAGAQVALADNWRFGFAGSYEETELTTTNKAHSDGERGEGGVVLKNRWGPVTLATAAFGGYGSFDTHRTLGLVGIGTADGEDEIRFGGGHSRLAIAQQGEEAYVKLILDLDATYLEYGGFNETNGGVASLHVAGNNDWVLSATGAVELGANFEESGTVRPYVRAGITAVNGAEFTLTSSFLSAPAGITPFTIASRFDNAYLDVAAGLDVLTVNGLEIKLNYDGRFSDNSEMHGGSLKASAKF